MSERLVAYDPEFELFEGEQEAGQSEDGGRLGEVAEMALAAELLDIPHEAALDQFVRRLVARVARGLRTRPPPRLSATLIGLLSDAFRRMPAERAGGSDAVPGSATLGGRIAALAASQLGLELEGLSPEDREFESARQITRFVVQTIADGLARGDLGARAAQAGFVAAARRYAPGLLGPDGRTSSLSTFDRNHQKEAGMHNIDRTVVDSHSETNSFGVGTLGTGESGAGEFENGEFEYEQYESPTYSQEAWAPEEETFEADGRNAQGVFNEAEEMELAAELLEVTDEQELDQFLSSLLHKAVAKGAKLLRRGDLQQLGGVVKGAIQRALPPAGGALGAMVGGPLGSMIGRGIATAAGGAMGLEAETLSTEDREFEGAKQLVRLTGAAVENASASGPAMDPQTAAQNAVVQAARVHAPGLLRRPRQGFGSQGGRFPRGRSSGRWIRRGNRIVLFGI